jgi:hypothetical protein
MKAGLESESKLKSESSDRFVPANRWSVAVLGIHDQCSPLALSAKLNATYCH